MQAQMVLTIEQRSEKFIESLGAFETHRKEIGHKLTALAQSRLMAKCARWGFWYARLLIELAIEKGWRGVIEPDRGMQRLELDGFVYVWTGPYVYDEESPNHGGGFYYYPKEGA